MISVIVPVYNVEKTLERCIDSIVTQSYSDLEIILVNDGTQDSSRDICEEYKKKDSRIRIVDKENGGLSSARNCGLDICSGEYISFVDSDDWIEQDFYQTLINNMVKFECDIVISNTFNIDEEGRKWRPYKAESSMYLGEEALECNLGCGYPCDDVVWNKLYKKELWEEIRFPFGRIHEDTFVMAKVMSRAKRVYFDDSISYFYLQRGDSIAHQSFNKKSIDKFDAYAEVAQYIYANFFQYYNLIVKKMINCGISALINMHLYRERFGDFCQEKKRIIDILCEVSKNTKVSMKQIGSIFLIKNFPFCIVELYRIRKRLQKR